MYVICDAEVCRQAGWPVVDLASACIDGGARLLQIRAKEASAAWLLDTVEAVLARSRGADARVIVNDRADVAAAAGADGVHVGQDDLAPGDVRQVVGPNLLIGLSTHTPAQLAQASLASVDYVAIGPVFDTGTKDTGYAAVGVAAVEKAAAAADHLPLVAIGGITLERAPSIWSAGAESVAVISDLFSGGDPARRVREYLARHATI